MLLADMGGTPYGKSLNFLQFSVLPTVPCLGISLGPGICVHMLPSNQKHTIHKSNLIENHHIHKKHLKVSIVWEKMGTGHKSAHSPWIF